MKNRSKFVVGLLIALCLTVVAFGQNWSRITLDEQFGIITIYKIDGISYIVVSTEKGVAITRHNR